MIVLTAIIYSKFQFSREARTLEFASYNFSNYFLCRIEHLMDCWLGIKLLQLNLISLLKYSILNYHIPFMIYSIYIINGGILYIIRLYISIKNDPANY